jgi:cupin 2 domain-containing protein
MTGFESGNLDGAIPGDLPEELVTVLATGQDVRVERIVSHGQASPPDFWYDQEEHEFVLVSAGRARVRFESGETMELGPGDYLNIPAHFRHRVDWTDPDTDTIWLAVFYR